MTLVANPPAVADTNERPMPRLRSAGVELDPAHVGWLVDSSDIALDPDALRARMARDGYLYMAGLLDRDEVLAARRTVCDRLAEFGWIDDVNYPRMDAVVKPHNGQHQNFMPNFMPDKLADGNAELMRVLYAGPMMSFFDRLFGEPARHFDFTWFRSIGPGKGTPSHIDVVYMGRGETERLYTAWTPIGDTGFAQGGLMVLDKSNNNARMKSTYGRMDVDSYCENKPDAKRWGTGSVQNGWLGGSPEQIRRSVGGLDGRWLTGEFRAGDVLIFSVYTLHASCDNRSNRIRLSSDSRYQPASSPADERWIGPHPIAHGPAGKRGRIC